MKLRYLLISCSLLLLYLLLCSHELFLKLNRYQLVPGQAAELFLFNGTFDTSENVITRDRIIDDRIWGPGYSHTPQDEDYYDRGEATYLRFQPEQSGTYLAGVSTLPRTIELEADAFRDYLVHEGLEDIQKARQAQGIDGQAAREQYAKHVKAIFQVGQPRSDHGSMVLGYPIEFIPLSNPYDLRPGDAIFFQLLYEGRPLGHQVVHYSVRQPGKSSGSERSLRTDERGRLTIIPEQAGQWYLATIYMVESSAADLDYESQWATLTFAVQ